MELGAFPPSGPLPFRIGGRHKESLGRMEAQRISGLDDREADRRCLGQTGSRHPVDTGQDQN